MSADITVHMGPTDDRTLVTIEWFDHDVADGDDEPAPGLRIRVRHRELIRVQVEPTDHPRTLSIRVNDKVVWQRAGAGGQVFA